MYYPTWEEIDPEDMPRFVDRVNRELKSRPFDALTTVVKRHSLPFYAEYDLLEFTDTATSDPVYTRRVLFGPEDFHIMNWTNGPIYTVNERAPINVNEDNAPTYAKFFFNFVKGRHGRFVLVENVNEVAWNGSIPDKGKEAIAKIIQPVTVTGTQDDKIIMTAHMVFKDSLFRAQVHVERDGMVSLSDEALVVEGMPIIEDIVPEEG